MSPWQRRLSWVGMVMVEVYVVAFVVKFVEVSVEVFLVTKVVASIEVFVRGRKWKVVGVN